MTTPSWNSDSTTTMNWSILTGVQDENNKNQKSVADDAQPPLVPRHGQGQGPGRHGPTQEQHKMGEKKVQLSTHSDSVVHVVADTAVADTAAAIGSVPGENLNGEKSMRQAPYSYSNQQQSSLPLLPLLTDLIDDEAMEIKRNVSVQFLLDFAIIGHPKCGTTFLLRQWLGQHAEIVMPARETRVLSGSTGAVQMVQALYPLQQVPLPVTDENPPIKVQRGYKNPAHILRPWALQHFETYWPTSKLIIGVRHPVLWFESFYNYRLKRNSDVLPPPASLMGACTDPNMVDVCTDNANFHVHLAMLGKTNLTALERVLFPTSNSTRVPRNPVHQRHLPNPVFLYDVSQLDGKDADVSESVRRAMQDYLGLQQPLPVLAPAGSDTSRSASEQMTSHKMRLDICLPEHDALRQQLLQIAWQASEWITTYFLPLSDVTVPAPDHFRSVLLNDWRRDPCDTRK
jgi:hypothetical protein